MAPEGCPLGFPGHRGRASLGLDRPPPSKAVIRACGTAQGSFWDSAEGLPPASALVACKLQRMRPSSFYDSVVSIHTCSPQRKSGDIETASQVSRTSRSHGQCAHIDPGRALVAHFLSVGTSLGPRGGVAAPWPDTGPRGCFNFSTRVLCTASLCENLPALQLGRGSTPVPRVQTP